MKFWIVALVAAIFFLGCAKPAQETDNVLLQTLGRYASTAEDGRQMGWPGSGLEFTFNGTRATIAITDGGQGIMDLSVNNEVRALALKPGRHVYTLVETDTRQRFHIRLTRRTEIFDTGLFTLDQPELDGEFVAVPPRARKIIFLGDSITAGFGVRGDTKDCQYNPSTNAPYLAYAGLAAKMLEAEPHLIAISGRGVVHNWDANPAPVMPLQIDYALPDHPELGTWDHSQFLPDVIVTTLGTNDWSVIDPGRDKFRAGYRDMLAALRARYPKAHIVTASGPLLDGDKGAAIRDGIDWAMAELADANISTIDFTLAESGLIWSCNSHPGRDSMRKMAKDLTAHINAQIGWNAAPVKTTIVPPVYMWPDGKAHFTDRVAEIAELPKQSGGVMLIGDSITEGWLNHTDLLPDNVSNHGVGWDTTTGLKARLPQILPHTPDKIFILIGTNDLSYDRAPDVIAGELWDSLKSLRKNTPTAEIFVTSILPREVDSMPKVIAANRAIREAVSRDKDLTYIDLVETFSAEDGSLRAELTDDGLHLNRAGYEHWAEAISGLW